MVDLSIIGAISAVAGLLTAITVRAWKTPQDRALSDRQKAEKDAKEFVEQARTKLKVIEMQKYAEDIRRKAIEERERKN